MSLQWLNQSEQILFGQNIAPEVDAILQQAVYASSFDDELAEKKLWQAQQMYPEQLEVYVAIYKFYIHHARLQEALQTLRQAIHAAAKACGLPANWQEVSVSSCDWNDDESPQRVYLYSLKALSSVLLRLGSVDESYQILQKLYEIDPQDQTGSSVIHELARRIRDEED